MSGTRGSASLGSTERLLNKRGTQGSIEGSGHGSRQWNMQGISRGSMQGSRQGSMQGSMQGSSRGSVQGSSRASAQGNMKGSSRGSMQASSRGSMKIITEKELKKMREQFKNIRVRNAPCETGTQKVDTQPLGTKKTSVGKNTSVKRNDTTTKEEEQDIVNDLNSNSNFNSFVEIIQPAQLSGPGYKYAIGVGGFGHVFQGKLKSNSTIVAVKVAFKRLGRQSLQKESQILAKLKTAKHVLHSLKSIRVETNSRTYAALVMQYGIGHTIPQWMQTLNGSAASKAMITTVAQKGLDALKEIHDRGILHLDTNPANIILSEWNTHANLYLLDFGHSVKTESMLEFHREGFNRGFVGTDMFSSHTAHKDPNKSYQSYADDCESLGFVLWAMSGASLPWEDIEDHKELYVLKKEARGAPSSIATYLKICRSTKFGERPDYRKLKNIFNERQHGRQRPKKGELAK